MAEPLPDPSPVPLDAVARLAELESALAEARAIQRAQANAISLRDAHAFAQETRIARLKAERLDQEKQIARLNAVRERFFFSAKEALGDERAEREHNLAVLSRADALRDASALKDRQIKDLHADLEAQIRLSDAQSGQIERLKRDIESWRCANADLRAASAAKDQPLADAHAEIARLKAEIASLEKYPDSAKVTSELLALRRDLAASDHAADRARGALVGLAYRLGELENDRLTRERNRAADHAILHHNV